jgi:hypothetical protein
MVDLLLINQVQSMFLGFLVFLPLSLQTKLGPTPKITKKHALEPWIYGYHSH